MARPDGGDGFDDATQPSESPGGRRTSASGAPAAGAVVHDRFSSDEIFQRIIAAADEEITSKRRELFFSGVAGGLAITITFLALASMTHSTDGHPVLSVLLYPLGFLYIILGGYQLYTENTLPPVALTLERFASVTALLRHWLVVLLGNFTGGAIGAVVLAWTGVFSPDVAAVALDLSEKGVKTPRADLFFKGAVAGLIVAGVVWVEYASRDTISRLVIIYLAFLLIPLGNLFHVVVSFTEFVYMLLLGEVGPVVGMVEFVIPVLLGNTIGGIVLVTVVNYYQTSDRRLGAIADDATVSRLSLREWLFGGFVGRPYVPLIEHHGRSHADRGGYRMTVPISNPRTERHLVELACTIAAGREAATVHLVHIVQVPSNRTVQYDQRQRRRITDESDAKLEVLRETVEDYDVAVETSTIVSYSAFKEIFNQARKDDADTVVMGWGEDRVWDTVRTGRPLEELTNTIPCDFLVLKDRGLDTSRLLLATAGGPDSDLSAEVAAALRSGIGTDVALLHVVDSPADREDGEAFLAEWAAERGLADAEIIVDDSGDVEAAIAREATENTLVLIGATERGLLSRLARDSLHLSVVNDIEASVLLAERPYRRKILQRLLG